MFRHSDLDGGSFGERDQGVDQVRAEEAKDRAALGAVLADLAKRFIHSAGEPRQRYERRRFKHGSGIQDKPPKRRVAELQGSTAKQITDVRDAARQHTLAAEGVTGSRAMVRIYLTRQNSNHPDQRKRRPSRASCEAGDQRYETAGPAPIYKLTTLLWLHGHGGAAFEVWDDVSPFGKPGGLAMRGRVRNWARLVKEKPNFTRKAKPDSDFMPDEREVIARAAGTVVDMAGVPAASGLPGAVCVTRPADGPEHSQGQDDASAGVVGPQTPVAA